MGLKNKKVLITCGPTWVAIDPMRILSNTSTGELGQRVALGLTKAGARVTLIEGAVAQPLKAKAVRILKFQYFDELLNLIKQEAKKKYDIIIHAAAVSDYRLRREFKSKIDSHRKQITLELVPTEKLINYFKKLNKKGLLVGFKLEPAGSLNSLKSKVNGLLTETRCDLVVANYFKGNRYQAFILGSNKELLGKANNRKNLSQKLITTLKNQLA